MQAVSAGSAAAGGGELPPPAGITVNPKAEGGSWFVAVRVPQALPHWGRALLQGAAMALAAGVFGWLRARFDVEKVAFWGVMGAVLGFALSKMEVLRSTTVVSGNDCDVTIDNERLALYEVVDCELQSERGRNPRWSIVLRCRTEPAVVALRRLSREQAEFCFKFLAERMPKRVAAQ